VGFEQTTYTFAEDAGIIEVCTRFFQPDQIDPRVAVELLGITTPDTADSENTLVLYLCAYELRSPSILLNLFADL